MKIDGTKYSHIDLVNYIRKYPSFIGELFELFESHNLGKLKDFFAKINLSSPYLEQPRHKGYLRNRKDVDAAITSVDAYMIDPDILDQNYLDDRETTRIYSETVDQFEEVADKHFPPVPRKKAIDRLCIQADEQLLEFGTGPGANFAYYPGFCRVVGIDVSPRSVQVANERIKTMQWPNISARLMDIHHTDFPDNTFDKVLSLCGLCVTKNPFVAMKEVKRIAKPNARILLYEPCTSPIAEVAMMQYLVQPVGRTIGAVWFPNFPPYTIPYNTFYDLFRILNTLKFRIEKTEIFDPPFESLYMLTCVNVK